MHAHWLSASKLLEMSERSVACKTCPLCTFEGPSVKTIISHLRVVHSHDPNFAVACGLNGCGTTSRSFSALYSHVYRHHPDIIEKRKAKLVTVSPEEEEGELY